MTASTVSLMSVYPRVCGGTGMVCTQMGSGVGLSPRVRGNHPAPPCHRPPVRSIPACAGEPPLCHTAGA